MKNHSIILESLKIGKNTKSGKIIESVSNSVKISIDKFFKKQRTPSQVKKRINNILNHIYLKCNELGDNAFLGGSMDYEKSVASLDDITPTPITSIDEVLIQVKFFEEYDFDSFYKILYDSLLKDMKENIKDSSIDSFSISIGIDIELDSDEGYIVSIDRCTRGFVIRICHQRDPYITESISKFSTIRYFRGKNPWDKFKFEFSPYRNKRTGKIELRIDVTNEYWDSHDYAFIDSDELNLDKLHSYSNVSVKTVKKALETAMYSSSVLRDVVNSLHITEALDLLNAPFIGKKKSYSEVDDDDDEDEVKDKKSEKDDPEESSTGVFGSEIGLPIDKENCESTSVSGVSTPTGVLNPKRKIIEGFDSEDTKDLTLICPECDSQSINIRDSHIFHCAECGYEWELHIDSNRDTALDNSEDEAPLRKNQVSGEMNNIYTNPKSDYRFNS